MLKLTWARFRRKPLVAAAVLLFTAIITMALCGLHNGNNEAQIYYDSIYDKIDVTCTITNLAGDQSDHLTIPAGTITLFTGSIPEPPSELMGLVENVQIKGSTQLWWNGKEYTLTGITSTQAAQNLWSENGCTIFWNDGITDNIFCGNRLVCIIPRELAKTMESEAYAADSFSLHLSAAYGRETDYDGSLEIVGTYHGKDEKTIYCPWEAYAAILRSMGRYETADSLSATLRNNDDLQVLRETAANWFAEPDPNAAGMEENNGFYLALDINDSQLVQAKSNLDNSMSVNQLAAVFVFALSACTGAFVGFLMIRNRKREIILMRTIGTPNRSIYGSFILEQMICAALGTIIGGVKFRWSPANWLLLFVCIYFAGLSIALVISLHNNLLTSIKEDE